jgi:hypothetical protein
MQLQLWLAKIPQFIGTCDLLAFAIQIFYQDAIAFCYNIIIVLKVDAYYFRLGLGCIITYYRQAVEEWFCVNHHLATLA